MFFTASDDVIFELNTGTNQTHIDYMKKQVQKIIPSEFTDNEQPHEQVYWKYDIDNGILSYLQRNDNLNKQTYAKLNRIRDLMWQSDKKCITQTQFYIIVDKVFV